MDKLQTILDTHRFTPFLIPIQPRNKKPHTRLIREQRAKYAAELKLNPTSWKLFEHYPPTADEVTHWVKAEPDVNIGIILGEKSGLICCEEDGAPLPFNPGNTVICDSRRGGHYYMRWQPGLQNAEHKDADGLGWELRANSCYMIAPGSVHESGHIYSWREGFSPDDTQPAILLVDLEATAQTAPKPTPKTSEKIPAGARHAAMLKAAGTMRKVGMETAEITSALVSMRKHRLEDPATVPDSEIEQIVKFVMAKEATDPPVPQTSVMLTANALMQQKLPDVKWAIPGIMPEGIGLLCGKPKRRKSFLCLNTALAIATGGKILGQDVEQGKVLYISYEDGPRQLQKRLKPMLQGDRAPDNLMLAVDWPTAKTNGLERLDNYLTWNKGIRLVIVDPFARFRDMPKAGLQIYYADYEAIVPLKLLAEKHSTSILVVHHLRKSASEDDGLDEISGSTGLTGAVDYLMLLKPTNERGATNSSGQITADLLVTGRDVDESEMALYFDPTIVTWQLIGSARANRMSQARNEILNMLEAIDAPTGPRKMAELLNKNESTVTTLMRKMQADGVLIKDKGKYSVAPADSISSGTIPESLFNPDDYMGSIDLSGVN